MSASRGMTFAEVFVVLALVFFLQTVINFSLLIDTPEPPLNDISVINVSQVPSGNNLADHVRYLRVGELILLFRPDGCRTPEYNEMSPVEIGSRIGVGGRCEQKSWTGPHREYRGYRPGELEIFLADVEERYGIITSVLQGKGLQTSFVFAVERTADVQDPGIGFGLCLCLLTPSESNLLAEPTWGLGPKLPFPHPLVVERLLMNENQLLEKRAAFFFNESALSDALAAGDRDWGPELSGVWFENSMCILSGEPRAEGLREVTVPLFGAQFGGEIDA